MPNITSSNYSEIDSSQSCPKKKLQKLKLLNFGNKCVSIDC